MNFWKKSGRLYDKIAECRIGFFTFCCHSNLHFELQSKLPHVLHAVVTSQNYEASLEQRRVLLLPVVIFEISR